VVVFEDLHWIDGETQTLLDSLVDSLPAARLLLLVNYRPEYQHAWDGKTYYRQLRIDPLPPESADELLDALRPPPSRGSPARDPGPRAGPRALPNMADRRRDTERRRDPRRRLRPRRPC